MLRFMAIMKRVIVHKKLYGLSASIKFLNTKDVADKKEKSMFKWIAGILEEDKKDKICYRKKYLLYPDSLFLKTWTYIIFILFAYTTIFVPYKIAFVENENWIL